MNRRCLAGEKTVVVHSRTEACTGNVNGCPQGDLICKLKAKCRVFKDLLLVKRDLVDELTVCPRSLLVITWLHLEIQSDLMIWRTHFDWG
jgi:hypothetical protein